MLGRYWNTYGWWEGESVWKQQQRFKKNLTKNLKYLFHIVVVFKMAGEGIWVELMWCYLNFVRTYSGDLLKCKYISVVLIAMFELPEVLIFGFCGCLLTISLSHAIRWTNNPVVWGNTWQHSNYDKRCLS